MGYGHRAIALTQLSTPDWQNALDDMKWHIFLYPSHDPEAYRLRAWIHDNLCNHEGAERDRQLARRSKTTPGSYQDSAAASGADDLKPRRSGRATHDPPNGVRPMKSSPTNDVTSRYCRRPKGP